MRQINQQASQLLVQIKKEKPNKAKNAIKPQKTVGWAFLKNAGFSEP